MSAENGFRIAPQKAFTILFIGNSIGTNTGGVTPYPDRISTILSPQGHVIVNNCVGGESLATTIANYSTRVAPYVQAITGKPLLVVICSPGGVDIVNGTSAAATYTLIQSLYTLVSADAGQMVTSTIIPGALFTGAADTRRIACNALIDDRSATAMNYFWPLAEMLQSITASYFQGDNQHLSDKGHEIIAGDFARIFYSNVYSLGWRLANSISPAEIWVGNIEAGFVAGGIAFSDDGIARMGYDAGTTYLRTPVGGLVIYNHANSLLGGMSDAGQFSALSFLGPTTGVSTNSSVIAGQVGEIISSAVATGSAISLTTNTGANVTSISLTAGDWDVEGNVNFNLTGATATAFSAGISSTSATIPTDGTEVESGVVTTAITGKNGITVPMKPFRLSATTTIYLIAKSTFTLGTETAYGSIVARRRR